MVMSYMSPRAVIITTNSWMTKQRCVQAINRNLELAGDGSPILRRSEHDDIAPSKCVVDNSHVLLLDTAISHYLSTFISEAATNLHAL